MALLSVLGGGGVAVLFSAAGGRLATTVNFVDALSVPRTLGVANLGLEGEILAMGARHLHSSGDYMWIVLPSTIDSIYN
ncbi:hypothetical protein J6590_035237 [Homalodisca vitripennis]|nr:hypothetical protein J6590_035237 [Homalodisca vitripennis]